MSIPFFQIDAFTTRRFAGNPAAVMSMEAFAQDAVLQALAAENNLPETAFLVKQSSGDYQLRWFTPTVEVPLCGHATLASASVVMERLEPGRTSVTFHTASGPLYVRRGEDGYVMDLPARPVTAVAAPAGLEGALGAVVRESAWDGLNFLALLEDAAAVRGLRPDLAAIQALQCAGVIVTAAGDLGYDMVSRYFAPAKGIPEDPVTGGAHCALTPFWAARLGKEALRAFQASPRGGEIGCRLMGERVELTGECVFYLEGKAEI